MSIVLERLMMYAEGVCIVTPIQDDLNRRIHPAQGNAVVKSDPIGYNNVLLGSYNILYRIYLYPINSICGIIHIL